MPAAGTTYFACFPLQESFFDKDTGLALAAGTVSFFSDPGYTTPKNVYQYTNGTLFPILGVNGVMTLSSIGTFVDGSGDNVIPFLWPYQGDPLTPSDPLVSQPYYIKVKNSAGVEQFTVDNWPPNVQAASSTSTAFTKIVVQKFAANGTYTPDPNLLYCTIECMGAGGGGAGTGSAAAGAQIFGGGGGAGSYSRKTVSETIVVTPQSVSVGVGGTAGAATAPSAGGVGGLSSVGSICVANGGAGGVSAAGGPNNGGAGGAAGTGDITGVGEGGLGGLATTFSTTNFSLSTGLGGSTQWGSGGGVNAGTQPGQAGQGYGAGGSGGCSVNTGAAQIGGPGAPGYVVITEYCSA